VGNVHTNRREFTGKDGGSIKHQDVSEMTTEELEAEALRLLKQIQLEAEQAAMKTTPRR
jgi:predicted DNA-binding protein (UPF0251 family)